MLVTNESLLPEVGVQVSSVIRLMRPLMLKFWPACCGTGLCEWNVHTLVEADFFNGPKARTESPLGCLARGEQVPDLRQPQVNHHNARRFKIEVADNGPLR